MREREQATPDELCVHSAYVRVCKSTQTVSFVDL